MAQKEVTLTIPVPIEACYKTFEEIGKNLEHEFSLSKANPPISLEWKRGFSFSRNSNTITLQVNLRNLDNSITQVTFIASAFGIIDAPGNLPKAIQQFAEPFKNRIVGIQRMLQEGLMCPRCFTPCASGTKFCPKDGTPIGIICSKCN